MSVTATAYAKTRAEIIALFDWDADSLTPEQTLRADCATALRLGLDALQGALIRGESVDMAKMLFFVFLVLFVLSLVFNAFRGGSKTL